jgi:hypothetical protein
VRATFSESEKELEEARALEEVLAGMVQLDGEDGTINTRLARRDIDCMFFSPSSGRGGRAYNDERGSGNYASSSTLAEEAKVLPQATHRPFGMLMSTTEDSRDCGFPSAAKDISVIREVHLLLFRFGRSCSPKNADQS